MIWKDESGAALLLIIIIVLSLLVLGFTMAMYSMQETDQVAFEENQLKAHYIARSGAHAVATYMMSNPEEAEDLINSGESELVEFAGGYYKIQIIDESTADETLHRIRSTGIVNDVAQVIDLTLENKGIEAPLYANNIQVSGGGAFKVTGGDVIYGDTISGFDENNVKDGELIQRSHVFNPVIPPCSDPVLDAFSVCPTPMETIGNITGTHTWSESRYVDLINLRPNARLIFAPPVGQNLLIKANNFRTQNAHITVRLNNNMVAIVVLGDFIPSRSITVESVDNNGGFLLLYVQNYGPVSGNCTVTVGENAYFNVYVFEGGIFNMAGTPNFDGSIYAPHASSLFLGNSTVNGWLITNIADNRGNIDINFVDVKTPKTSMSLDFYGIKRWTLHHLPDID